MIDTTKLDEFLERVEIPMQKARARAALTRTQQFKGKEMRRHVYAEELAGKPGVVVRWDKGRVVTNTEGSFFLISDVTKIFAEYLTYLIIKGEEA